MTEIQDKTTIIPAAPGWNIAAPIHGGKDRQVDDVHLEPVIAWMIISDGEPVNDMVHAYTRPITVEGTPTGGDWNIFQRPDGSFTDTEKDYISRREVIAEFQRRGAVKRQRIFNQKGTKP